MAAGQWPFQALCDQMCIDVLDPVWEVKYFVLCVGHQQEMRLLC